MTLFSDLLWSSYSELLVSLIFLLLGGSLASLLFLIKFATMDSLVIHIQVGRGWGRETLCLVFFLFFVWNILVGSGKTLQGHEHFRFHPFFLSVLYLVLETWSLLMICSFTKALLNLLLLSVLIANRRKREIYFFGVHPTVKTENS